MRKATKLLALLLVTFLLGSLLASCGSPSETSDAGKNSAPPKEEVTAKPSETDTPETVEEVAELPLTKEPVTFTYWVPMAGLATQVIADYSENLVYQELEKRTNVKIEFIHPAVGQEAEQFNLMIGSGDLPDIIEQGERYKGGIDKGVSDGIYIKLNDLVDKNAPNFKKLLESSPELKKEVYSDEGNLMGFGMITSDVYGTADDPVPITPVREYPHHGPRIRKDWLDELGLKIPTTIDEWYTVLKAIQEKKKPEIVMLWSTSGIDYSNGTFLSAFDIGPAFYLDTKDNKVKFGPIEPGYKEYLSLVNKWYKEGLIDSDFAARSGDSAQAALLDGKAGAWLAQGSFIIRTSAAVGIDLAGAPYPKKDANTDIHWRYKNNLCRNNYGVITSACENPDIAVKWFDYHYTEDGFKLFCFGPEGNTYNGLDEKGRPKYSDYFELNGKQYSLAANNYQDVNKYWDVFRLNNGSYLKSDLRSNPDRWNPKIEEWRATWNEQPYDYVLPPITMTAEEASEFATIMSDINTYRDEMVLKFILGDEPLDNFDQFVQKIKSINIDRAIEFQEAALKRYNER